MKIEHCCKNNPYTICKDDLWCELYSLTQRYLQMLYRRRCCISVTPHVRLAVERSCYSRASATRRQSSASLIGMMAKWQV